LTSNDTAETSWSLPISYSGRYNLAVQLPAMSNAATNLIFTLRSGQSPVWSVSFTNGLPHNQWKFLGSAFLDPVGSNSLAMIVVGSNQPGTCAIADVLSVIPLVSDPALSPQDQLAISASSNDRLLQFTGEPGSLCSIQRSTNLLSGWLTLDNLTVPLTGVLQYKDRDPVTSTAFYRVSQP